MTANPMQFQAVAIVSLDTFFEHIEVSKVLPVHQLDRSDFFGDVAWGLQENKHTLVSVDYVFKAIRDALTVRLLISKGTALRLSDVESPMQEMRKKWELAWQAAQPSDGVTFPDGTFPDPFIDIE